jgi:hypothetical protein
VEHPGGIRIPVRISPRVWQEEVERLTPRSPARIAAERDRRRLEAAGLAVSELRRCRNDDATGTRLDGLFKLYVPIRAAPPSERPYGFVLSPHADDGVYLAIVAFGERHPPKGTRSVYERAHKRLHGHYPDQ